MAQETSKHRWNRIELDYYRAGGLAARWRPLSAILVLTVAAAWLVLAPRWNDGEVTFPSVSRTRLLASPGPLARVHATWESRCESCHTPFAPINGSRWSPLSNAPDHASDTNCRACHAGLPHHPGQDHDRSIACAECHRDHQGRDASMTRVGDGSCVGCHADLAGRPGATEGARLSVANSVTRFDRVHPEFAAVRPGPGGVPPRDPVRLRFSHRVHMTPGMNPQAGGKPLLTYAALNENDRRRYGWIPGTGLDRSVALDCSSCHRLPSSSTRLGAYMEPVSFESNCRACHPLPFDPAIPGVEARHGVQLRQVVGELRRIYQAEATREDPELLKRPVRPREVPGNRSGAEIATVGHAVDARLTAALRKLLPNGKGGCTECHSLTPAGKSIVGVADAESLTIEPVRLPAVWLTRSRFDHSAHVALKCDSCHAGAATSNTSADILLPGIATCLECHSPPREGSSGPLGGAGFGCAECHGYHGGVASPGPASTRRSPRNLPPESLRTIRDFLDGAEPRH